MSPFIDTSADGWKNKQKYLSPGGIFSYSVWSKFLMASSGKERRVGENYMGLSHNPMHSAYLQSQPKVINT